MACKFRILSAFLLCLPAAGLVAAQDRDFSKVEIKATRVAGSVYMLEGAGGNIGASVGPDGILIVDDQFAPLADKIRAALRQLDPGKLQFILNTHWHGDHTGSNAAFSKEGTVIAHENVRKRLSTDQTVFGEVTPASPKEALPVITFPDALSIHFNGEEIQAIHFPHGHTDGDSVIFFTGSNVVHLGDDFFAGRFPFVDLGSGGSVQGLIANLDKVLARLPADAKIIPGHGPLSTPADLKTYRDMLATTSSLVKAKKDAGKDLATIQKEGLPDEWKEWGSGFIKTEAWIATVFESLEKGDGH
ncbi:MAG TPA: MBL fold metallo-hydrolase [Acidobacteria bacterium]|nr:MBL fold metallo-hydrolase [Acidobacteriota bacterium]